MNRAMQIAGQVVLYGAFGLFIGLFSRWPEHHPLPPEHGLLKLSIRHQGELLEACVDRSFEELAKLPPNMRSQQRCPRERAPLQVELRLDGELLHSQLANPAGLARDGAATLYFRLPLAIGEHSLDVRLEDNPHREGFDYHLSEPFTLATGQVRVVDFDNEQRRLVLR